MIFSIPRTSHPLFLFPGKSKYNLMSDRVNLVTPASHIECLLYLPNVRAIQYKLGPERLTRLGNSNVLRLPLISSLTKIYVTSQFTGIPTRDKTVKTTYNSSNMEISGRNQVFCLECALEMVYLMVWHRKKYG